MEGEAGLKRYRSWTRKEGKTRTTGEDKADEDYNPPKWERDTEAERGRGRERERE